MSADRPHGEDARADASATPRMHADDAALAHGLLDGTLSAEDAGRAAGRLASDPAFARAFARLALLHDAIERESTAGVAGRRYARRIVVGARLRRLAAIAATIAVVAGIAWIGVVSAPVASAADIVARIAEVARRGDRTYILRDVSQPARRGAPDAGRPAPSIDGAVLYLRAPSSYVLARLDADGAEVFTGSDGRTAWEVPAAGPVRVSRDPSRFAGALPGSRQGIPFVDPHEGLSELARGYDLVHLEAVGEGLSRLVGTRRGETRGGPKRIEIDYEPASAVIRRIRLDNLPQARGGPRAVEFDLVDDRALGAGFFGHDHHHDADRRVIEIDTP